MEPYKPDPDFHLLDRNRQQGEWTRNGANTLLKAEGDMER